jgi:hypothetical protein
MRSTRLAVITGLLITALISAGFLHANADQFIMTNGDRISGEFIGYSESRAHILTPHSGLIQIDGKQIQEVLIDRTVAIELISGERIIGRIASGKEGKLVIDSVILGKRILDFAIISNVQALLSQENDQEKPSATDHHASPEILAGNGMESFQMHRLAGQQLNVRGKGTESSTEESPPRVTQSDETVKPKKIGQKPPDEEDIRKIFLRQSSVLLQPRQMEFEIGISYKHNQSTSPFYIEKFRQFDVPLTFRVGINDRIAGYVSMAASLIRKEHYSSFESIKHKKSGIGDTTAGLNFEIFRETAHWPEIISTLSFQAPTGGSPQEEDGGISIGTGHWAGTIGVQFIKTTDPVVLFWGLHYTHDFAAHHYFYDSIHKVQPGETFGYNFGFGFAVNEDISLSVQVLGSYQCETEIDGMKISGSSVEPVALRSALSYRFSKSTYIEPFMEAGLNNDQTDFIIGVSATHKF